MTTPPFPTFNPNLAQPPLILNDSQLYILRANKVTGLDPPTSETDATSKQYVDTVAATTTSWKESTRVATTADISLFGLQIIDGVFVSEGDRVLVKDQADPEENGLYSVVAAGMWTRTGDAPTGYNAVNMVMLVDEGTLNASKTFRMDAIPGVVGTDDLTFTEYATGGSSTGDTWKNSVIVATTSPGTLASDFEVGDTVDGVVLALGDRILIKDQTTSSENGIYTVNSSGAPTRADDATVGIAASGTAVIPSEGTTNASKVFICVTADADFGDSITYEEISGSEDFVNQKTWKDPVVAATTGPGTLATDFEAGDTIDGVTLALGDRILIKDQTTTSENGIYTVNTSGAPTRATDAQVGYPATNAAVLVNEGTNAGNIYRVTTPDTDFGDSITIAQFAGGSATPAGSNTEIQYNDSGSFGASSDLTWNSGVLGVTGCVDATEVNALSDMRYKKNIEPISVGLQKLKEIECYSYNLIETKDPTQKLRFGVLAQQLEKIGLNHLVNNTNPDHKSVNYTELMPVIIKSIQELMAKIENKEEKDNILH